MYASILAGGSGTRLWPLSTRATPKQFLRLPGPRTLLQETVERVAPLVPLDNLYVVTAGDYRRAVAEQVPGLPSGNIVGEPAGRGTAASIGLAATLIAARDPQAVMGSFASDHVVTDVAGFRAALAVAEEIARAGYLVTTGIQPTYPETGYGYIRFGAPLTSDDDAAPAHKHEHAAPRAYVAEAFVEKPPRQLAEDYLRSGNYVWNASIFVWRVDRILEEIRRFVPPVAEVLAEVGAAAARSRGRVTPDVERVIAAAWPRLTQSVTIDTGVMEHAERIAVIPISVGWNDIGGWAQVATLFPTDERGNSVVTAERSEHLELETFDTLVYSTTGRTIALAGVSGLVVVDTGERLLICAKDQAQLVKEIAEWMRRGEQ